MKSHIILRFILFSIVIVAIISVITGCTPDIETLKNKGDVKGLIKALEYDGSESGIVIPAAQEALVELGPESVELLINALNHKEIKVSGIAARLLGMISDTRAIEPLIKALDKEDIFITSAYSLGLIGNTSATESLLAKLNEFKNSGNKYNYEAAVDALTMINIYYILPVSNGEGVHTKTYVPDEAGPHPVVLADKNLNIYSFHRENLNSLIPVEWRSLGFPEKIELVLCYEFEEVILESCPYGTNTGTITRIRQDWNVKLLEAATGKIIATGVLEGDEPTKCPGFRASGAEDTVYMGEVSDKTLIKWLQPFVE